MILVSPAKILFYWPGITIFFLVGFKGFTYFYDLDGNGEQETKLTFSGLTSSDFDDPCINIDAAVQYVTFTLASTGLQLTEIWSRQFV